MIDRSFDPSVINSILNHPDVFHHVAPWGVTEPLDMTALIADQRNVMLMGTDGGVFFHWQEPSIYVAHTTFLPGGSRGKGALEDTRDAVHWMFTRTDAVELLSFAPECNRGAQMWALMVGGEHEFDRPGGWMTATGPIPVRHYALRYPRWVRKDAKLKETGEWFHHRLAEEKRRLGATEPQHPNDPDHDRHVGAAVAMIRGGQIEKAFVLYNRYARTAGYQQIRLVSYDPLIIDQGDALLLIDGDSFEVLKCLQARQ